MAALLILLLLFRSVVAAGLPVLGGRRRAGDRPHRRHRALRPDGVSPTAPTVASMVGLGVGIDYALLLLTRILERLGPGEDSSRPPRAPLATAGRAVVCAGATVLVSLMGLRLSGLADLRRLRLRHRDRRGRRGVQPRSLLVPALGQPVPPAAAAPRASATGARVRPHRASAPSAGPTRSPAVR